MLTTPRRPLEFTARFAFAVAAFWLGPSLLFVSGCSKSSDPAPANSAPAAQAGAAHAGAESPKAAGRQAGNDAQAAAAKPKAASAGAAPFDTTFLDADTELFVFARVADILDSSLVQTLSGGNLGPLNQFQQELGISPRDVDTVTVGVSDLVKLSKQSSASFQGLGLGGSSGAGPAAEMFSGPGPDSESNLLGSSADVSAAEPADADSDVPAPGQGVVAVIRTKAPIDVERLEGEGVERVPHGKSAYYRMAGSRGTDKPCLYLHNDKTLIAADESSIKQIIEQGEKRPRPTADLGFLKSAPHLLVAVVPEDKAALFKQGQQFRLPGIGISPVGGLNPGGMSPGARPVAGAQAARGTASSSTLLGAGGTSSGGTQRNTGNSTSGSGTLLGTGGTSSATPSTGTGSTSSGSGTLLGTGGAGTSSTTPSTGTGSTSSGSSTLLGSGPDAAHAAGGGPSSAHASGGGPSSAHAAGGGPGAAHAGGGSSSAHAAGGGNSGAAKPSGKSGDAGTLTADALMQNHADAFALLVDLSEGIGLDVVIKCDSPQAAQQIHSEVDQALAESKTQYEAARSQLPGAIQQIVQPLMDSLKASVAKSVVTITTALPEEQQSVLPMLPMAVMGMMMGNMNMSGGGGGGGFEMGPAPGEIAQQVIDSGHPAANADELPEGLQLKGLTRWAESPYGDQAPAPLAIDVVALGGPAADAVAFGKLKLTQARVDEATSLKWQGTTTQSFDRDPLRELLPIERDGMFSDHPDQGVATGFLVVPPATPTAALSSVAGEFSLQIAGSTEEITIADVTRLPDGRVEHEKLTEAAIQVVVENGGGQGQLEISYNESPLIGRLEPVSADGLPLDGAGSGWTSSGGRKTLMFQFPGEVPTTAALRVTAYGDLQMVTVPFRFENLPMPEPQELSEQQRALLVWTRGESPSDHPDLTIEAQGRWRMPDLAMDVQMPGASGFLPDSAMPDDGSFEALDTDMELPGEDLELQMQRQSSGGAGGAARGRGPRRAAASDEPLRILVDLTGPLAQSAEAIGEIQVSSAKTNIDTELAYEGAEVASGVGDAAEEFVAVDRESTIGRAEPPNGLRIILKLTPPNQPIGALTQLTGTLKLRTVRERTEAILHDLQSRVGTPEADAPMAAKPITDRDLLKFGLKPVVGIGPNRVMMRLLEGKDERISEVAVLDLNGRPVPNVSAATQEGGANARGHKIYTFDFPDGVPQKVGMRISVNMGVKDVSIPIRIRDLPLPPLPQAEN